VSRSATTLRVPGSAARTASIAVEAASIEAASRPKTLRPRRLRKPVASISVRVWIGIQKRFGIPG
jgi:hypothetical protein